MWSIGTLENQGGATNVWSTSGVEPMGGQRALLVGILESQGASDGRKVDDWYRSKGLVTGVGRRNT